MKFMFEAKKGRLVRAMKIIVEVLLCDVLYYLWVLHASSALQFNSSSKVSISNTGKINFNKKIFV